MRSLSLLAAIGVFAFSARADYTIEDISPHFSTNIPIIWQASFQNVPTNLWIYKKLPRTFSAETISRSADLASFKVKLPRKAATKTTVIWAERGRGEPRPPYFSIVPERGEISYTLGDRAPDKPDLYLTDQTAVERAWTLLAQLKVDQNESLKINVASTGEWGVFLPRQIDGIQIYDEMEGFSLQQFGPQMNVGSFSLVLPKLKRSSQSQVASPLQIIGCIRGLKTPLMPPQNDEFKYFERIKALSKATKLTVVKLTPYYGEGIYGKSPPSDETSKDVSPFAELDAVAEFGNASKLNIRLISPILASEVIRLLSDRPDSSPAH